MIWDLDKKEAGAAALIDSKGAQVTYGELVSFAKGYKNLISERTLIFILCDNVVEPAMCLTASFENRVVPLLLGVHMEQALLENLIDIYGPQYIWAPKGFEGLKQYPTCGSIREYDLYEINEQGPEMYEDLSLLLTTSGSTGSPKLVRHSYKNIQEQPKNVAAFFELDTNERAMLDLPYNYTYGLSVVMSHLYSGATVLLCGYKMMQAEYWEFLENNRATSYTGVPFSYDMLHKMRFTRMNLPHLNLLTQGAGKLPENLFREMAEYARDNGKRFIPTYGQTEGTARMAYLPSDMVLEKTGSIGKAIPNGRLYLIDEKGNEIETMEAEGEMAYEGPNVTLGYAVTAEDLKKGDERNGKLVTGDIAKRDKDGYYYIIGRMKRFLKLYGNRVSLDRCELLLKEKFEIQCACGGNDDNLIIFYEKCDIDKKEMIHYLSEVMKIYVKTIKAVELEQLPKNEAGKILYGKLSVD